tara:strand:+ start:57124 stop:57258 length:135 start_codon:yes stop_codon:yes gene_type:complete
MINNFCSNRTGLKSGGNYKKIYKRVAHGSFKNKANVPLTKKPSL